ncbi:MAG: dihydroneopterin aldolase [Verrucomicrobia bacterium]|jgi:FolB domain-containing protein|nr:dihydroneopterin aldolase [Verrucomicrobiota bacterium]
MDKIIINDLEVSYRIGVPDEERAQPQRLLLTIEMSHDFRPATATDDIGKTINYYAVSQRMLRLGENKSWRLLETLAEEIAGIILKEFGATSVQVEIKKFIIPEARWVAVRIVR